MKTFSKDRAEEQPKKADNQPTTENLPIDITGKVKREVKELGRNLHHFIVDWQNPEVVLPKN